MFLIRHRQDMHALFFSLVKVAGENFFTGASGGMNQRVLDAE
jgi:hypothetical protein